MRGELGTGPSPEENILLSETKIKEHLEINYVEQIKKMILISTDMLYSCQNIYRQKKKKKKRKKNKLKREIQPIHNNTFLPLNRITNNILISKNQKKGSKNTIDVSSHCLSDLQ